MARSQLRSIDVTPDENDAPAPKKVYTDVFGVFRARGHADIHVSDLEAPEWSDVNGGITPEWSDDVRRADNAGAFDHMDVRDTVEGAAGDMASGHVTTVFVRGSDTVVSMVRTLSDRGHVRAAMDKVADELTGDVDISILPDDKADEIRHKAALMTAYHVANVAKGWLAERIITATDEFAKGSMSNDEAGQDVRRADDGTYMQVKSVTLGYKPNHTVESTDDDGHFKTVRNDVPVIFYQWDCRGRIHVGRNYKAVNKAAAEAAGVSVTTTLGRTHTRYKVDGRTYRRLWW